MQQQQQQEEEEEEEMPMLSINVKLVLRLIESLINWVMSLCWLR
jgi:hypothetical protein